MGLRRAPPQPHPSLVVVPRGHHYKPPNPTHHPSHQPHPTPTTERFTSTRLVRAFNNSPVGLEAFKVALVAMVEGHSKVETVVQPGPTGERRLLRVVPTLSSVTATCMDVAVLAVKVRAVH